MTALVVGVLAALLTTAAAYATRRRELLLGPDEGYLWYGTQRVVAGEQPVRDLRSYEPGRYWLTAPLARMLGTGLVATRLASHLAVGTALVAWTVVLAAAGAPSTSLLLAPALVLAWRPNHFKLFDAAALVLVAASGTAALAGAAGGWLLLGGAVAVAATTGLNLGLYGALAAGVLLLVELGRGGAGTAVLAVAAGGTAGGLPLLRWLLRPGVAAAVWRARVEVPAARGSTNLPLPVPLPWRPAVPVGGTRDPVLAWTVRCSVVVLPVAAVAAATAALLSGDPLLVARVLPPAVVGLVALHHFASRADLAHLGLAAPFLLLAPALLGGVGGVLATAFAAVTVLHLVTRLHPRLRRRRAPATALRRQVGGDLVWVPRGTAAQLDALRACVEPDDAVAAVPAGIHLVAALGRRSAVHDSFAVYAATTEEDEAMRRELEVARPVVVLVDDRGLDGRDELRFSCTHPRTWAWLHDEGTPVDAPGPDALPLPEGVTLWRVARR